jgi:hypothetical protein
LGQPGNPFRELMWIETRSMPRSGVPERRTQPFLRFAAEDIDARFAEMRAGKYHSAEVCSLPRILTIAVERPAGQDVVILPGSFTTTVPGGREECYRLVGCELWHRAEQHYTSVVFDPADDTWISYDDGAIDGFFPVEEDGGYVGPARLAFYLRGPFLF